MITVQNKKHRSSSASSKIDSVSAFRSSCHKCNFEWGSHVTHVDKSCHSVTFKWVAKSSSHQISKGAHIFSTPNSIKYIPSNHGHQHTHARIHTNKLVTSNNTPVSEQTCTRIFWSEVAQWERAGLITLRPLDRNQPSLHEDNIYFEILIFWFLPKKLCFQKHDWASIDIVLNQNCVESRGIDPRASRMLSERSTIWASLPLLLLDLPDSCSLQESPSWARRGSNTGPSDLQSNALPTAPQTPSGYDILTGPGQLLYFAKNKNSNGTAAWSVATSCLHNEGW